MGDSFWSKPFGSKNDTLPHKPLREDDRQRVHELALRLAQATHADPYRGSVEQSNIASVIGYYDALGRHIEPMRHVAALQNPHTLSEGGIERIFPVMHRAYEVYVGTKLWGIADEREVDALEQITHTTVVKEGWFKRRKVTTTETRKRLVTTSIADNRWKHNHYPDCGILIDASCPSLDSRLYTVNRLRPEWKRADPSYVKCLVMKRPEGELAEPDACVDIHSKYFKIDYLPPKDFVRVLMLPDDQEELRRATLHHLLSLPEILGPYLDKKEAMIR